jgi:hypothetical protein
MKNIFKYIYIYISILNLYNKHGFFFFLVNIIKLYIYIYIYYKKIKEKEKKRWSTIRVIAERKISLKRLNSTHRKQEKICGESSKKMHFKLQ